VLILQAKRFYREATEKQAGGEITDPKHPVFAGQILAEMLAGICHEEFYNYGDQEVSPCLLSRAGAFVVYFFCSLLLAILFMRFF
jgi:hypothetical protein